MFEELIGIAVRENNAKRKFLFVNRAQGKYVPSVPGECKNLFFRLGSSAAQTAERLAAELPEESGSSSRTVVIGFAETATALGAFAAEMFGEDTPYFHTTREPVEADVVASFEEEHSHAINHQLFSKDRYALKNAAVIVMVDDELTTGKTIRNFTRALKSSGAVRHDVKVVAASVLNCMAEEDLALFEAEGITAVSLIKSSMKKDDCMDSGQGNGICRQEESKKERGEHCLINESQALYEVIKVSGVQPLFSGSPIGVYRRACQTLSEEIMKKAKNIGTPGQKILVLGMEEFMYPAIFFGAFLEQRYEQAQIRVQATGRSPIAVMDREGYIIKNRSQVISIFDRDRMVNIYNLERYDKVFVLTNAGDGCLENFVQTAMALREYGSYDITLVQWGK